jgi:hypothetical protein
VDAPALDRKVFVDRRLVIVIACHVRTQQQSIRGNDVVGCDLGAAATIVELERIVDVTGRIIDVHFASCRRAVTQDCVTKGLWASGISRPQMSCGEKKNGERCEMKCEHGSVLCTNRIKMVVSRKREDCWVSGRDGKSGSYPVVPEKVLLRIYFRTALLPIGYSAEAPPPARFGCDGEVLHPSNSGEGRFRAIMFTRHNFGAIS